MAEHDISSTPPASRPPDWNSMNTEVLCPLCSYNLRGLAEPRCPECGYRFDWPEVLDPNRRRHPYLFEHHPERNLRSFWRTAVGVMLPSRFWASLHPTQPSNPRRLIIYVVIGQAIYLLALLGYYLTSAWLTARAANASGTAASWTMYLNTMPPAQRQRMIRPYASVQAFISARMPPTTMAGVLRQRLTNRYTPVQFCLASIPLAWPWATYLALSLFWISMRRLRVDKTHILRCVLYSFDLALWAGLYIIVLCAITFPLTSPWKVGNDVASHLAAIWLLGGLACTLRLYAAYKLYLRFRHPFTTVLLSQTIVGLLALNVLALVDISSY